MRVGRADMCLCIHRKSSRASWTPLWRATRPPVLLARAFCMVLKMLRAPGSASAIERSSPSIECHFFMLVRCWERGTDAKISARRAMRCGGRRMVRLSVSIIQPKINLMVPHEQSPSSSFFMETGSRRSGGSEGSKGRKTSSTA